MWYALRGNYASGIIEKNAHGNAIYAVRGVIVKYSDTTIGEDNNLSFDGTNPIAALIPDSMPLTLCTGAAHWDWENMSWNSLLEETLE